MLFMIFLYIFYFSKFSDNNSSFNISILFEFMIFNLFFFKGLPFIIEVRKCKEAASADDCYYVCSRCSLKVSSDLLIAHVRSISHVLKIFVSLSFFATCN